MTEPTHLRPKAVETDTDDDDAFFAAYAGNHGTEEFSEQSDLEFLEQMKEIEAEQGVKEQHLWTNYWVYLSALAVIILLSMVLVKRRIASHNATDAVDNPYNIPLKYYQPLTPLSI